MEFLRPATWDEALAAKAEHPTALPISGGTDVMVEMNFDVHRPPAILDLNRVTELTEWSNDGEVVRLGAAVPYSRIIDELSGPLPGLALAAHTVGSPQIRNRAASAATWARPRRPGTPTRRCWRPAGTSWSRRPRSAAPG